MNARTASLEWIEELRFQIVNAGSIRACLHAGVSWLSDWIDLQFSNCSHWIRGAVNYQSFCRSMASEIESPKDEDDELWVWSWGMAAEMFDIYDWASEWTEEELLEYFRHEITDVEMKDRDAYARHLFISAMAYIHGWTAHEAGYRGE